VQQKRSVNFNDWKEAFKNGFDGFILECGDKTAQEYIIKFSEIAEVAGTPVFRSDGVHVRFQRATQIPASVMGVSGFSLKKVVSLLLITLIVTYSLTFMAVSFPTKTVTVQGHILPREFYATYTETEIGYYLHIRDINTDYTVYIEVDDYDTFIKEYREQ